MKHVPPPPGKGDDAKARHRAKRIEIDASIATAARELVRLVYERINFEGCSSSLISSRAPCSDLVHSIRLNHRDVLVDFIDYPGEWLDLVSWREKR